MNKGDTIIDLRHIVKRFFVGKPNELEILHGIDLQVKKGEFLLSLSRTRLRQKTERWRNAFHEDVENQ